ncbi:transferase [Streptomyces viridochromogenes DSM 40736]|uniref:Transferase n=1 Tax=Streptomyces viridochromogenes (strain DSM 40736 / JCM 4977 / BCRC 1201 / Tue 494) TaxID=591159 RepID=D9XDW5_STRVT|nr:transferase [Streptomyces viridochromogenes DSM 40736]
MNVAVDVAVDAVVDASVGAPVGASVDASVDALSRAERPVSRVAVVVIGYDDAAHVTDAVRSALAQGPAVREVVAVDDCSTDGSAALLDRLAASESRLKVIRRRVNSGGCGTPRNTGLDAVTSPYVMFLDSDDVLPPGAVDALLEAATGAHAEVVSGLCVRRELPSGREVPWQPRLYALHAVVPHPAQRPRLVHDTLCVNKLYRTGFLREHRIRFPEGRFPYEDVVFTARVLAAAPRIALVPDRVYVWHVRRSAERLSISLDRAGVENWRARTQACRQAYEVLLGAGQKELARVARAKFLDHDLRMYVRELGLRDAAYRRAMVGAHAGASRGVRRGTIVTATRPLRVGWPGGSSWPPRSRATCPGCGSSRRARRGSARRTPAPRTARPSGRRSFRRSPWSPC